MDCESGRGLRAASGNLNVRLPEPPPTLSRFPLPLSMGGPRLRGPIRSPHGSGFLRSELELGTWNLERATLVAPSHQYESVVEERADGLEGASNSTGSVTSANTTVAANRARPNHANPLKVIRYSIKKRIGMSKGWPSSTLNLQPSTCKNSIQTESAAISPSFVNRR